MWLFEELETFFHWVFKGDDAPKATRAPVWFRVLIATVVLGLIVAVGWLTM